MSLRGPTPYGEVFDMISVYRRGRIYWIRGSVEGVPIPRQSLGTQFKDVAAQLAAKV
jgi:hypothetical protein